MKTAGKKTKGKEMETGAKRAKTSEDMKTRLFEKVRRGKKSANMDLIVAAIEEYVRDGGNTESFEYRTAQQDLQNLQDARIIHGMMKNR